MMKKIPRTIGNQIFSLKCGFGIGYGIGRMYRPVWVSVSDLNQNSGFGRTLVFLIQAKTGIQSLQAPCGLLAICWQLN